MSGKIFADAVIVGSGVAGGLIANELARNGFRVAVLEAGSRLNREEVVENFRVAARTDLMAPYPSAKHAPQPELGSRDSYFTQSGPVKYESQYIRAVGGTTWHWAAAAWRFLPNDFRIRSLYQVGRDWPIDYVFMEPFYCRAEKELGVSGDDLTELGSFRSKPYPMKPIPLSYMDRCFQSELKHEGYHVVPEPVARNSEVYDGRPPCCGNNNCMPICPIGAQYSGDVHISKAEKAGARLIENAVAYFIELNSSGAVSSIHFKMPDGSRHIAQGKIFVIAANGIETPKLLLISRSASVPNGVANSSDQVGRNLMDHPSTAMTFVMPYPVYPGRGPQEISSIVNFRDGDFRKAYGAKKFHFSNSVNTLAITQSLLESGVSGKLLDEQIYDAAIRTCLISSFHEQLPHPDNRVTLSSTKSDRLGIPHPNIHYFLDEYVINSMKQTTQHYEKIAKILGAVVRSNNQQVSLSNHIMGTTLMGDDSKNSVVDRYCQTHDHFNLFIAGSSVFASSACVNPTLTLAALSLAISDTIQDRLGRT